VAVQHGDDIVIMNYCDGLLHILCERIGSVDEQSEYTKIRRIPTPQGWIMA